MVIKFYGSTLLEKKLRINDIKANFETFLGSDCFYLRKQLAYDFENQSHLRKRKSMWSSYIVVDNNQQNKHSK